MPNTSLANIEPAEDLIAYYAAILANFKCRMTLREAEDAYSITHGELKAAIEEGKIRYYKAGKTQYRLSPVFLAEYIENYCTFCNDPLPS